MFARSYCAVRERMAYWWFRLTYPRRVKWTRLDEAMARDWLEEHTPWGEVKRLRDEPYDQDNEDDR